MLREHARLRPLLPQIDPDELLNILYSLIRPFGSGGGFSSEEAAGRGMSSDEEFLVRILRAAAAVRLEVIVVGSTAAVLQGAPVMTQDVDLLIRDTPRNREKLDRFCEELGGAQQVRPSELSRAVKLLGLDVPIDILFDRLPTGQTFESLRSRAERLPLGRQPRDRGLPRGRHRLEGAGGSRQGPRAAPDPQGDPPGQAGPPRAAVRGGPS